MKTWILLSLLLLTGLAMQAQSARPSKKASPNMVLRHVVLFAFKETSTPEDIASVEAAFRALPGQIAEIKGFEWGTNNSPENLAQGFTHCFLLSFASEADRDAYLPHPAHKAFGQVLRPHLDKVLVVDYWAKK
ncbi:MAG: Dabb family protein [Bacteroidia bacterium]